MKKSDIAAIFRTLREHIKTPESELDYNNTFQLLVAVILSAQATDKSVNIATESLFQTHTTPQDFINLGEDGLKTYIKSIGLFNSKAKYIMKTVDLLKQNYNSAVPGEMKELLKLPGVGRKTANVILNIAFKQPTMPVDTHVFRLANRIGFVSTTTPDETEAQLLPLIPKKYGLDAHHLLILHGRYVCKARKPLCGECVIEKWCQFQEKII